MRRRLRFWLTVFLFTAAVVVGAFALSATIRFMATFDPDSAAAEDRQRRTPPPTAPPKPRFRVPEGGG